MHLPFVQIEPTTRCNYTCKFCTGRHMVQKDISFEIFASFIDQVQGTEHIELQGEGEPFLHSRFFDMIDYASSKFPDIRISTITNGSLFTSDNINKILNAPIKHISVSLESAKDKCFQENRGGSLEHVRNGIKNLITTRNTLGAKTPVIGLTITILKSTIDEPVNQIADFYRELELDGGINIQPLQSMPQYTQIYSKRMKEEIPSNKDLEELHNQIKENFNFQKLLKDGKNQPDYYKLLYKSVDIHRKCPWLINGLYLNAQGEMLTCCHIKDYQSYRFGKIGETDINFVRKQHKALQEIN